MNGTLYAVVDTLGLGVLMGYSSSTGQLAFKT